MSRKYDICIFSCNHFEKSMENDHHRLSGKTKWWLNDRSNERGTKYKLDLCDLHFWVNSVDGEEYDSIGRG